MSRYVEYDDWSEDSILASGRWERNAPRVFRSANGQKALRKLRDALLALPEKRLIAGALCTIGRSAEVEMEKAESANGRRRYGPSMRALDLEDNIKKQGGEGVCAIGALLLQHHLNEGKSLDEAAAAIPTICEGDDGDALWQTASAAKGAGMVTTLAWQIAYHNDETLHAATPEERYERMLAWIDTKLVPA